MANRDDCLKKMSYPRLFRKFEDSIRNDCHSLEIKFGRSRFQEEIFRRGKRSLGLVIDHIRQRKTDANFPLLDKDVALAWTMVLNRIEIKIDPGKTGPPDLRNLKGWLAWAERFAKKK